MTTGEDVPQGIPYIVLQFQTRTLHPGGMTPLSSASTYNGPVFMLLTADTGSKLHNLKGGGEHNTMLTKN
jgi:hypothetical protein